MDMEKNRYETHKGNTISKLRFSVLQLSGCAGYEVSLIHVYSIGAIGSGGSKPVLDKVHEVSGSGGHSQTFPP